MATIQAVMPDQPDRVGKVTWTPLTKTTNDVGTGVAVTRWLFKSVQVYGTFGAAGAVTMQGSMDGGTTWGTIKDGANNDLVITDSKIYAIISTGLLIRPAVTAGDGSTSLSVTLSGFNQ